MCIMCLEHIESFRNTGKYKRNLVQWRHYEQYPELGILEASVCIGYCSQGMLLSKQ